ncbi:hypothetical protein XAP412_510026 [Xanthomonas phaseoli pv. phaseoli]|nr:hypothetical protein XAP412_510026 [Xanthomonas phaseoli pv. phaseoli]SOO28401.1 hypothetical protein XAP6164_2390012 [Xanthomonas phaseoli pv. phaseoli]
MPGALPDVCSPLAWQPHAAAALPNGLCVVGVLDVGHSQPGRRCRRTQLYRDRARWRAPVGAGARRHRRPGHRLRARPAR